MFKYGRVFIFILALGLLNSAFAERMPAIENFDSIAKLLKVTRFKGKSFSRKIKIAILDNGFHLYKDEIGKTLPADTVYHDGDASAAPDATSYHGTAMAILLSRLLKASGASVNYELHLFRVEGYSKLAGAVRDVIAGQFDLVLYSQVWEYGGDGDTGGFINALVDQATHAGVQWINAAGDLGQLTRVAPIVDDGTGWVKFKNKKGQFEKGVKLICHPDKKVKYCNVQVELNWNDTKWEPLAGTDKDLDFYLVDGKGKVITKSVKRQVTKIPENNDGSYSILPREELLTGVLNENSNAMIPPILSDGTYYMRVKIMSHNFGPKDHLRITAAPSGAPNGYLEMENPTLDENLLPPADNPNVIVIGAADDLRDNNVSVSRGLPLINFPGLVLLGKKKEPMMGSSQSAALAAALATLYLGTGTPATQEDLTAALKKLSDELLAENSKSPEPPQQRGYAGQPHVSAPNAAMRRYRPGALMNCLAEIQVPRYPELARLLDSGRATMIVVDGRPVVAYEGNFAAETGIYPLTPTSRVFMTEEGPRSLDLQLYPDNKWLSGIPRDAYEIMNTSLPPCR